MPSCAGVGRRSSLLSSDPSLAAHLVERYAPTAEFLALRQESLTSVTLRKKRLMLLPKFVPEIVKVDIVRANDYVAEFMQ